MASSHDSPGTPQPRNPEGSGAERDPFESAPAAGGGEEEWPIDAPLPEDFERPAERRLPVTPKPALRISPIAPGGGSSFESNRRAGSPAPQPSAPAPAPAPAPVSRTGSPTGHRAGAPRPEDDPFQMDEPLPAVSRPRPAAPVPAPAPAPSPSAGEEENETPDSGEPEALSGEAEEFEPRENPADPASAPAGRRSVTKAEKLGIAAVLVAVLALFGVFAGALHAGRPASSDSEADRVPRVPMKGEVVTLTGITTDWRARRASDRVSMVDTALPEVSRSQPEVLPEVKFTIDPAASKTGFLRFIFLDPEGAISGDVLVVKVAQGRLESTGGGMELISATEGAVHCSLGFLDNPSYIAYAIGESPRWTVEVSESTNYNSREDGWKRLGLFEIRPQ